MNKADTGHLNAIAKSITATFLTNMLICKLEMLLVSFSNEIIIIGAEEGKEIAQTKIVDLENAILLILPDWMKVHIVYKKIPFNVFIFLTFGYKIKSDVMR